MARCWGVLVPPASSSGGQTSGGMEVADYLGGNGTALPALPLLPRPYRKASQNGAVSWTSRRARVRQKEHKLCVRCPGPALGPFL